MQQVRQLSPLSSITQVIFSLDSHAIPIQYCQLPLHPYVLGYDIVASIPIMFASHALWSILSIYPRIYPHYVYIYTLPWGSVWSIPPKLPRFTPSHCPKMAIIRKKAMISWYLFGDRQMALFAITKPPMYGWDDFVSPKGQGLWVRDYCIGFTTLYRYTKLYLVAHPTNRKWVITPVINGISRVNPLITGVN